MGAWGTGIFENDDAADARAEWQHGLAAGEDPAELTQRLMRLFGLDIQVDDEEYDNDCPGLWLAMAAAQIETGHLEPNIRDTTLAVIAAGADLVLWEGEAASQRQAVMDDFASQLREHNPA